MNGIQINAINGGWLVHFPFVTNEPYFSDDFIRHQANILKEEFEEKDPILDAIKKACNQKESNGILVNATEIRDKNTFFFKTFPEVLIFLKTVVNDFE